MGQGVAAVCCWKLSLLVVSPEEIGERIKPTVASLLHRVDMRTEGWHQRDPKMNVQLSGSGFLFFVRSFRSQGQKGEVVQGPRSRARCYCSGCALDRAPFMADLKGHAVSLSASSI